MRRTAETSSSARLRILTDFVAVPLLAVYAALLHAYALKILVTGELPRNQIGWMMLVLRARGARACG